MNTIQQQVRRARTRVLLQQFGHRLTWYLFISLMFVVSLLIVPKVVAMEIDANAWFWGCLGGGVGTALLLAGIVTWLRGPTLGTVAQEVDKRFGLRERLSSAMLLTEHDTHTATGKALLQDAEYRAERIEIGDQFPLRGHPGGLLPLLPLALVFALIWVPNAPSHALAPASQAVTEVAQVKNATEQLKKQLEQRRRAAEAKGLEEASDLFKEIEAGLDKLQAKEATDRKDALVKLNDLKHQLEKRREELGSSEQMKQNLSALKDLEQGPADKVVREMEKGNFGEAAEQLRGLAKQLKEGELSPEQQKQLQKQVQQMQQQLQEMVDRHEQAKKDMERQIEQAKQEGDLNQAAKLQEKLDQLRQQDDAMQKMQKMANAMGKACEALEKGNAGEAAGQLDQMSDQLGEMQAEMEQLEDLKTALDQFDQAKDAMRCEGCSGKGCQQCQGQQPGNGNSDQFGQQDWGKGKGPGAGKRDLEEGETNHYQSQVRDKPKEGKAVASGFATGPNRKGVSQEEVKGAIQSALKDESDPLEDRPLPRTERDHTREYFDQLREGNP